MIDEKYFEPAFALLLILLGLILINHSSGIAPVMIGFGVGFMASIISNRRRKF
jgi:hypothetical protein